MTYNAKNLKVDLPEIITATWLKRAGACAEDCRKFKTEWPQGGPLTLTNLLRAFEIELDVTWFASAVLTAPAYKAYQEATATAYKAYQEATAPAYKAYQEATATAYKAYQEATATAYKAYQEATAPAEKAYQEATATSLLGLILMDAACAVPSL